METFGIRDLRERSGELTRLAEAGQLALLTKRDRPLMVGVPFNETLINENINLCMAVHLFSQGIITSGKAARLAQLPLETFIEKLGHLGIPLVDYQPEDLDQELDNLGE
ncbi:UPF0175 family protein [Endozoicomonas sp. Mp262]|uniref:UPF0175 family protein n=1 Tax=Endozoicomonas sp. Mp262 TaxID=2919499 RepID=UPI0021DA0026